MEQCSWPSAMHKNVHGGYEPHAHLLFAYEFFAFAPECNCWNSPEIAGNRLKKNACDERGS